MLQSIGTVEYSEGVKKSANLTRLQQTTNRLRELANDDQDMVSLHILWDEDASLRESDFGKYILNISVSKNGKQRRFPVYFSRDELTSTATVDSRLHRALASIFHTMAEDELRHLSTN